MSRGGRGSTRGRGGRRTGTDISWDDEPIVPISTKPEPLFPEIDLPTPRPLSSHEIERVDTYLNFRDEVRNGPLYTILKPSSFTDEEGKVNPRAGFDPFTSVEKYSARYHKPERTIPDLSGHEYLLRFFPRELWSTVDPERKDPAWKTVEKSTTGKSSHKRKRPTLPVPEEEEEVDVESEDSDAVVTSSRRKRASGPQAAISKKRKADPTQREGQKAGLEAEDDIPDVEQNEEEGDADEDAPQDSEFSESDDGAGDDYNAENYFDDGEGDDFDEGGGGGGEDGYYD